MFLKPKWLALVACVFLAGCPKSTPDTGGDNPGAGNNDPGTGQLVLSGKIRSPGTARVASLAGWAAAEIVSADNGYQVIAQSNQTGAIFRGTSGADGTFKIEIPDGEAGNTFIVTILGRDGKAVGPVLYGIADSNDGVVGLRLEQEVSLGTIQVPADPTADAIIPGTDADPALADAADPDAAVRLNDEGAPVGLATYGKGIDARQDEALNSGMADQDRDGLIDIVDADDDGDGVVDDFDSNRSNDGLSADIHANFFMNLKIDATRAPAYYEGTPEQISAALAADTVITFDVQRLPDPNSTRQITDVHALEVPGPTYLPGATEMAGPGQADAGSKLWKDRGYAFHQKPDRWDAFIRPNVEMNSGDTFTIEITTDDGQTTQYSRMINYVFKNIPRLVSYGSPGSTQAFSVNDPSTNGTFQRPIPLPAAEDLVLVFNPPKDDTGAYMTALDYNFEMFFYNEQGFPIGNIDMAATWPTLPAGMDPTHPFIRVSKDKLVLSGDTYTFTLPREAFPDTVQTANGPIAVGLYQIDIAAQCPSGNAAIILMFRKSIR